MIRLRAGNLWIVAGVALGLAGVRPAHAAGPPPLEPRALRLRVTDGYLKLRLEEDRLRRTVEGAEAQRTEYTLIEPVVSFTANGSVYHPNLVAFRVTPEIGYGWYDKLDTERDPETGQQSDELQNYLAQVDILNEKPYAVHLSASRQELVRDDDFFTREKVDYTLYEAQGGYSEGPVPFSVVGRHREETRSTTETYSEDKEDTLGAGATYERSANGSTELRYDLEDFEYRERGFDLNSGLRQVAAISDRARFGKGDRSRLNSFLSYEDLDRDVNDTTFLLYREDLYVLHADRLQSHYHYTFSDRGTDGAHNREHDARASLDHQLYESLYSTVEVLGEQWTDSGRGNGQETLRYGGGFRERYTKKLPEDGRISVHGGRRLIWEDRSGSGGRQEIFDERHALSDGEVTLLNQPDVDPGSVVVTASSGTTIYREGLDYLVLPRGGQTQIERVIGGRIPNGSLVLVDYTAAGLTSDEFTSVEDAYGARLDLWNRLLGVYARRQQVRHDGVESSVVEEIDTVVAGVDTTGPWFRAGAEYEKDDSTFSPYTAYRFYQGADFHPTLRLSLALNFRQQRARFEDGGEDEETYSFIGNGRYRASARLTLSIEGGAHYERGIGQSDRDRTLYTGRLAADYWIGRVTARLVYEYEEEVYSTEQAEEQLLSLRIVRRL
jgi:hypothetical protein